MTPRRGVALVMTVVALTTVITSAAAASVAPAAAGATAATHRMICVGLVVDARSIGSDVRTSCAKVSNGATGVDVLEAGGHALTFRHDGLLCTIDGLPRSGCAGVDDTHYWAYFHRAPGATTWVYSSEGPSTYQPADDSTEGWVYDNGTLRSPESVPYSRICPADARPTSAPTSSPSPPPTHRPSATPAPPTPSPQPHASATPPASPATHGHQGAGSAPPTHRPSTPPASSPASPPATASATSAALAGSVPPPAQHHNIPGLIIGLAVLAALGAATAVRFRRSRQ